MSTAKESLRRKVDQLSEEEAERILGLIGTTASDGVSVKGTMLTLEGLGERLTGKAAFRVPPTTALPFRKRKRIERLGLPASEMLVADRR